MSMQQALVIVDERQDLSRLHGSNERAGENQLNAANSVRDRAEMRDQSSARFGGKGSGFVSECLWDFRVRVPMAHQKNPQALPPEEKPLPGTTRTRGECARSKQIGMMIEGGYSVDVLDPWGRRATPDHRLHLEPGAGLGLPRPQRGVG